MVNENKEKRVALECSRGKRTMKVSVHNRDTTADSSSDGAGQTFYDAPALPPKRAGRQTVDIASTPSKRVRIRPPAAGLHGVKRVVAAARDVGASGAGQDAPRTTLAEGSNAEEDDSFARMKRPKKKIKQKHAPVADDSAPAAGKAVPLATGKKRKAVAAAATSTGETLRQAGDKPALSSDSEPDAPIRSAPTGGRSKAVRQAVSVTPRRLRFHRQEAG